MSNNSQNSTAPYWISITLITFGVLFLLQNFGFFYLGEIWVLWPLILIAIGIAKFREAGFTHFFDPSNLITFGIFALLANFRFLYWGDIWEVLPAFILILIGLRILLGQRIMGENRDRDRFSQDQFNALAIFGGKELQIQSENFRGGNITVLFGGAEVYLGESIPAPENSVVDVLVMFGGAEIYVPANWNVVMKGMPIFGGYADKRKLITSTHDENAPTLILRGFVMFGGIEIGNAVQMPEQSS